MFIFLISIPLLVVLPNIELFPEDFKYYNEKSLKNIKNFKTFGGPMGIGLAKSFEYDGKKVCFYNTVDGQQKLTLDKLELKCPKLLDR